MLCFEEMSLRALSELDQLEDGYMACVGLGEPMAMAAAMSALLMHLHLNVRDLGVAMMISQAELALTTDS